MYNFNSSSSSSSPDHRAGRRRIDNEDDARVDEAQHLLWSIALKATAPRLAIVRLLLQEKKPISIAEMSKKISGHGQVSLYRALEALTSNGIANKVNTEQNHALYEIVHGRKHHHHIVCTDCGDIEDVDICLPRGVERAVLVNSRRFNSLSRHSLEFFGHCKKCAS